MEAKQGISNQVSGAACGSGLSLQDSVVIKNDTTVTTPYDISAKALYVADGVTITNSTGGSVCTAFHSSRITGPAYIEPNSASFGDGPDIDFDDCWCFPDNFTVYIPRKRRLKSTVTHHTLWNNLGAWFAGDTANHHTLSGVVILGMSYGTTPGIGTITYVAATKTLAWAAPGDTAGTPVDCSSISPYTLNRYDLVSAAGAVLHIMAIPASMPASNTTGRVRITAMAGSKACTWVRKSGITYVREPNHTRKNGDAVILYGTGFLGQVYVQKVEDSDRWWFVDSRADGSGSGRVFGRRGITITGGIWDQQFNLGVEGLSTEAALPDRAHQDLHAMVALGLSDTLIDARFDWCRKYGIYAQCTNDCTFDVKGYSWSRNGANLLQLQGKNRGTKIPQVNGTTSDNLFAIVTSDYPTQCMLLPWDEGGVHVDATKIGELVGYGCRTELMRITGAANTRVRGTRIEAIRSFDAFPEAGLLTAIDDSNVAGHGPQILEGLWVGEIEWTRRRTNAWWYGSHAKLSTHKGTQRLTGVIILNADAISATNTIGNGQIEYVVATTSLRWRAPRDTAAGEAGFGAAQDVSAGGEFTLASATAVCALVVRVDADKLPTADRQATVRVDTGHVYGVNLVVNGTIPSTGIDFERLVASTPTMSSGKGLVHTTSGYIRDLSTPKLVMRGDLDATNSWDGRFFCNGGATIDHLTMRQIHGKVNNQVEANNWPTNAFLATLGTIRMLVIDDLYWEDNTPTGQGLAFSDLIEIQSLATIENIIVKNWKMKGGSRLIYNQSPNVRNVTVVDGEIDRSGTIYLIATESAAANIGKITLGNISTAPGTSLHSLVRVLSGTTLPDVESLGGLPAVSNDQSNTHVYVVSGAGGSDTSAASGIDLRIATALVTPTRGRIVRDPSTGDVMRYNGSAWTAL